jgi:methionyl aminopeptidase
MFERQVNIKSPADLKIMREAGRINATVLARVKELLQPGVTTADLNAAAEEVLKSYGCVSPFKGYGHPPFPASITVSINDEMVHGIPHPKRKLKEGDIVSIDCGTIFEGFVADSAFTAGVGEISPEAAKLLKSPKARLYAGIEKMRKGRRTGDVSAAIQNMWKAVVSMSPVNTRDMALEEACTKVRRCQISAWREAACSSARG